MYLFGWTVLLIISLWISLLAFLWAVQSGQFSDQARARYLPLYDEIPARPIDRAKATRDISFLLLILGLGILMLLAPVAILITRTGG